MLATSLTADQSDGEEKTELWNTLEITLIVLWSFMLCMTLYNAYHYLYKMKKYDFIPMILVYTGQTALTIIIIIYFSERLSLTSRVNTEEATWVFFNCNIGAASMIIIIGYCGLILELSLMLKAMYLSAQINTQPRRTSTFGSQLLTNESERKDSTNESNKLEFDIKINDSNTESQLKQALRSQSQGVQEPVSINHNLIFKKQAKVLEWVSLGLAIAATVIENISALYMRVKIKSNNILDNEMFYDCDEVVRAWEITLIIHCVISVFLCIYLITVTVLLIKTLKKFFKDQFKEQTKALMVVFAVILIVAILSAINDFAVTILQVHYDLQADSETKDGNVPFCYLLLIPCFTINFLHFKNMRAQRRMQGNLNRNIVINKDGSGFYKINNTMTENSMERSQKNYDQTKTYQSTRFLETIPQDESFREGTQSSRIVYGDSVQGHMPSTLRDSSMPTTQGLSTKLNPHSYPRSSQNLESEESFESSFMQVKVANNSSSKFNESFSSMSKGLLLPDHVLMQRQTMMIAQMKHETPQISEYEDANNSQNMSGLSPTDQLYSAGESSMDQYFYRPKGNGKRENTLSVTAKHQSGGHEQSFKAMDVYQRNASEQKKKMHNSSVVANEDIQQNSRGHLSSPTNDLT